MEPSDFPAVGPEGSFAFACTRCGECCFDQTVRLNPLDVFYLARGSAWQTSSALFAAGVIALLGDADSWQVVLPMQAWAGRGRKCRFLSPDLDEEGTLAGWRCTLHGHEAKPLVCAMSPLGAARDEPLLRVVPPLADCPGMATRAELSVAEVMAPLAERLAWARWYDAEIRPRLASAASVRAAFDCDADGVLADVEALTARLYRYAPAACAAPAHSRLVSATPVSLG